MSRTTPLQALTVITLFVLGVTAVVIFLNTVMPEPAPVAVNESEPVTHTPPRKRAAIVRKPTPHNIRELITQYAERHGIPHHFAHAVAQVESNYRCDVESPNGALGIMQVMPLTARELGVHGNLRNCEVSLEAGMRYLKLVLDRTADLCTNLSLYNTGIYTSRPRCTEYGRNVLALAARYQRIYGEQL